jgi:hypothetical protein
MLLILSAYSAAIAHDWYPMECCHGLDCAPVDAVEFLEPATTSGIAAMVVTTRYGRVVVPSDFPRRESKDNRIHACMRQGTTRAHLLCLFAPPAS